jgi:hypothetical protein
MADKYDKDVAYLKGLLVKDFQGAVWNAWNHPLSAEGKGGSLFLFITPNCDPMWHGSEERNDSERYGCLTEIRNGDHLAYTTDLTNRIYADERIPSRPQDITPESLDVLAEWQRIVDKEIRTNVPPQLTDSDD